MESGNFKTMFLTCVNINFRKSDHFPTTWGNTTIVPSNKPLVLIGPTHRYVTLRPEDEVLTLFAYGGIPCNCFCTFTCAERYNLWIGIEQTSRSIFPAILCVEFHTFPCGSIIFASCQVFNPAITLWTCCCASSSKFEGIICI